MDELEFRQRVLENPNDVGQDLLDAANTNPALQKILDEIRGFESELHAALDKVTIPQGLSARLMAIPKEDSAYQQESNVVSINSARPGRFRQVAFAACLVVALAVTFNLGRISAPFEEELYLGDSVLAHLYEDNEEINAINDGLYSQLVAMAAVNETMAGAGTHLVSNEQTRSLTVRSAKPCIIIPAYESAHLLV
jgi:hypothetical protein